METELIKPDNQPRQGQQAFSPFGCFIAAAGATLLTFSLLGSAGAAAAWAFSSVIGLPELGMKIALAAVAIPVLMATVWTAGRAWHVEQRLAQGFDVDKPVFSTLHYLRGKA